MDKLKACAVKSAQSLSRRNFKWTPLSTKVLNLRRKSSLVTPNSAAIAKYVFSCEVKLYYDSNNAFQVLFRLLWTRLNIDDFIDRARQKVMRFCVHAQVVSKKDCKKAVDEAVSQVIEIHIKHCLFKFAIYSLDGDS